MKRLLLLLFLCVAILPVSAQLEGTLYFMNNLPQVSGFNPAFVPRYQKSLGLPLISSFGEGYYNNGFSYNDMISKSGGEVRADLSKWIKALQEKNYIMTTAQVDLLRFGYTINPKLYIQVNMTGYEYTRAMLPREVASLFVNGTAPYIAGSSSFSPQAESHSYLETAASASYKVNEKLRVGGRFKYLSGIASATTISSNVDLSVGTDYQISAAADLNMKTSGVHDNGNDAKNFHYNSNPGFGIDLGATYQLTNRLILAASLVDLGKLTWKNSPYAYTLDKGSATYTFAGVDLKEVINGNSNYMKAQGDSIQKIFKPKESKTGSYSTVLPAKMYLSGNYALARNLHVGGLFFTEKFQGRVSTGVSTSLIKDVGKWLTASVSYTVSNRSYNNFGAGLSFNFAPVQFYVVGDNIWGAPGSLITTGKINSYINGTQVFNMRFGLNLVWGWTPSNEKFPKGSYNTAEKSTNKEKVTDGNPSFLKVRKKKK